MKYDHEYRSCTRTYSTLRIYPNDSHPDLVTQLLNIKPTCISVAGTTGTLGRKTVNGWFLSSKGKVESRDSRRHIDWILDKIEAVSDEIHDLRKQGALVDISCFWGSATGNGGPTISPEQMTRLATLNLAVWWDVYFEGSEENDE